MSKLKQFLDQPYPFYFEGKSLTIIITVVFLMAFGFNYLFSPFNVYVPEHKMNYVFISMIHALVTIIVLLCLSLLLKITPKYTEKWNVSKEIIFLGTFLILVGVGQFLIRDIIYDNPNNWSWQYFFEEIRNTFLVGILFVAILVPLNFSVLYRRNQNKASLLSQNKLFKDHSKIYIKTAVKGDDFHLKMNDFLYAKADRNYVEIYSLLDSRIEKKLKRISIKDLDIQLTQFENVIRTHRSYMVNLNHLVAVKGNAQGYKIQLTDNEIIVPVSRSYIPKLEVRLKTS